MTTDRFGTSSWEAIGTTALVRVADETCLRVAEDLLRRELARIDHAASSYRSDSELMHLLSRPGKVVAVSNALHEAVAVAVSAAAASDGLVDPTLGVSAGWREIELLEWALKVPTGATLDLGATGKALAADRAAAAIARAIDGRGVLVSLGGDIATAGEAPDGGWQIHVTDDHRASDRAPGQTVAIRSGGLATSGTTVRRLPGSINARDHHIVDPRTGRPADGPWRTASVTAANCVDANTASTAAIILGQDASVWLARHGLAARLVAYDGKVVRVGGWPEGEDMSAPVGQLEGAA